MMKRLYGLPPWLLSGTVLAIILWLTLSAKPLPDNMPTFFGFDKIGHCGMFWLFAAMLDFDYWRTRNFHLGKGRIWCYTAVSALLGVVIEVLQYTMAVGRSFEWGDILADSFGALLAVPTALFFIRTHPHG